MLPSALFRFVRRGLKAQCVVGAVTLALSLAAHPLTAQTAHYGTVVTLGSGFVTPTGVAVDGNGNVYVSDNGNNAVKEILAVNGSIPASPTINTLGSGFSDPFTVAVDASGNVYVADYGNHAVKEIEAVNGSIPASPTIRTLVSGTGFIFGTAVDSAGDVFYTEYNTNSVKEIVAVNGVIPASPTINTLGSGFNVPAGLAVDASGNVFVADQNNNVVKEILAAGGYTTVNTVATGFNTLDGVAVDASGNLYVADDGNNLVKEVLAVNGSIPASPTILTLASGFSAPFDVAVDLSGNVYVADRDNNAVKEIQIAGLNFGSVNLGSASSSPLTVNFTFDTAGTLGSTTVLTQGATGLDFTDAGGGTCTANTAYTAGDICTVNVSFSPRFPGPRYGSVELLSGTGTLIATGYVQGVGVAPQVTFATSASGALLPAAQFSVGSGFSAPNGVAVDASRNIFVLDAGNNQLKEITASSALTATNTLTGGFNAPNNLKIDGSGNLYTADTGNSAVKEIVAAGGYTTVLTLGSGFSEPYGVAVDGNGNVFVADFGNSAVKEIIAVNGAIPASPTIRTLASGLLGPQDVAVDGSGNVFVALYSTGAVIEIFAVDGSIPASPTINTIASGFAGIWSIASDEAGNLYVTNSGNNTVQEIVAAGGYSTILTLGGGFLFPESAAVDAHGNVLVADTSNNAIQYLDYRDVPSPTFADTKVGATSSDSPQAVVVSNNGNAPLVFPLPTTGNSPSVPANFAWDSSSTCEQTTASSPEAFQLAGGTSCTMAFDFKPTMVGSISGFVAWTDNNLNVGGNQESIQLIGTGTQIAQTISFTQPTSPVYYGVSPITLSATGGASGNPVTFSIVSGPGSLSGTNNRVLTVTGAGNIVIAANQAGNTNYAAAPQVTRSITVITPVPAALTAPTANSTLAGPTVTFTWSTGTGVTEYALWLGTNGVGSSNVYTQAGTTATSQAVTVLPTNGAKIYARLLSKINGAWQSHDYTYTAAAKAVLTSPAPSSPIAGPSVTFTWTAATGSGNQGYWLFLGTTGVGSKNLYDSGQQSATSATFKSLPNTVQTIYARVYTEYNGVLVFNDYTYSAVIKAVLTSPTPKSILPGTSATFSWTAASGPAMQGYWLFLGTTGVGSKDLYDSGQQAATSATFKALPTNGATIYARVYTKFNTTLLYNDYTYTAAARAVLTTPAPGRSLSSSSATFSWTTATGSGLLGFALYLGTTGIGSNNLYSSGQLTTTSVTVNDLPTNGIPVYARLYTNYNGVLVYNDYTYTAWKQPAAMITPVQGSTLAGTSQKFTWTSEAGSQGYWLFLGTTGVGSKNLFDSNEQTSTSATANNLPTNGATIYARVYTSYNGVLVYNDYTYKAK